MITILRICLEKIDCQFEINHQSKMTMSQVYLFRIRRKNTINSSVKNWKGNNKLFTFLGIPYLYNTNFPSDTKQLMKLIWSHSFPHESKFFFLFFELVTLYFLLREQITTKCLLIKVRMF